MKLHPDFAALAQMPMIGISDVPAAQEGVKAMLAQLPEPSIPKG